MDNKIPVFFILLLLIISGCSQKASEQVKQVTEKDCGSDLTCYAEQVRACSNAKWYKTSGAQQAEMKVLGKEEGVCVTHFQSADKEMTCRVPLESLSAVTVENLLAGLPAQQICEGSFLDAISPSEKANALNDKITQTGPLTYSQARVDALNEFDSFFMQEFPYEQLKNVNTYISSDFYKLINKRMDALSKEIKSYQVPEGKIKIWYVYNMGVIAKTSKVTVGFDIAGTYVDPSMASLVKDLDILILSHPHADHFDPAVVKEALNNGVKVVVPEDKVRMQMMNVGGTTYKSIFKDANGISMKEAITQAYGLTSEGIITVEDKKTIDIKGVKITGFSAVHEYPNQENLLKETPVMWFYVNIPEAKLLHTGDGYISDPKVSFADKNLDLFLVHYVDDSIMEYYYNLAPNTKYFIPLHLHEVGHGKAIFDFGIFKQALDQYSDKGNLKLMKKGETAAKFVPMIWGESIEL
ncbi:MBL fold metallo-hydrolase [Candidatus Woesearchaeota archaeon]|nr:MBL fold metallo-hydrolase [Candidatus Woesearchaeota archaeon]